MAIAIFAANIQANKEKLFWVNFLLPYFCIID